MIITNIDYVIKFKDEDNIADNGNDDNNNNSNNGNNHGNHIYFSIISDNTCSNLYLHKKYKILIIIMKIRNIYYLFIMVDFILCANNEVSRKVSCLVQ